MSLLQIWSNSDYIYTATTSGAEIIDMDLQSKIAYIPYSTGYNTVWANDEKVYFGTNESGIKYIYITCISGTVGSPNDLTTCLYNHTPIYGMTSQNIRYIHGNDEYMMWCTNSGVDVYKSETGGYGYRSSTIIGSTRKCFMTSTGKFYYTTISGETHILNRVDSSMYDWTEPNYKYIADGGSVLASGIEINDIFATEDTSVNGSGYNTIFAATSSGVYVIDEGSLDYVIYYKEGV